MDKFQVITYIGKWDFKNLQNLKGLGSIGPFKNYTTTLSSGQHYKNTNQEGTVFFITIMEFSVFSINGGAIWISKKRCKINNVLLVDYCFFFV